jgi:hypothetical protein
MSRTIRALVALVCGAHLPVSAWAQSHTLPSVALAEFRLRNTDHNLVSFNAAAGIWGPGAQPFSRSEGFHIGPYGIPPPGSGLLGGFFKIPVPLPFVPDIKVGAGVTYDFHLGFGANLDVGVDLGSILIDYPMDVVIEYPTTVLQGERFVVKTRYYPFPTAGFHSIGPTFRADLKADIDFAAVLKGEVDPPFLGFTVVDKTASKPNFKLFSLSDYFQVTGEPATFSCCSNVSEDPGLAGIINGWARRPILDGSGTFGDPGNPNALVSFVPDDHFLFAGIDLTNYVSKALIGIPLSSSFDAGIGRLDYHILEVAPGLAFATHQALRFEPQPTIQFEVYRVLEDGTTLPLGTTAPVNVGQDVTFSGEMAGPLGGEALKVVPVIGKGNRFSNATTLQGVPSVNFDPFRINFTGGDVNLGFTKVGLGDFSFNPFDGPKLLSFSKLSFDLASYSAEFSLNDASAQSVAGKERMIVSDTRPPLLLDACPTIGSLGSCDHLLQPRASGVDYFVLADRTTAEHVVTVNGQLVPTAWVRSEGGAVNIFQVTIPPSAMAQPGSVRLKVVSVATGVLRNLWIDESNPIDIQIFWGAGDFARLSGGLTAKQFFGAQTLGDSCGNGPIGGGGVFQGDVAGGGFGGSLHGADNALFTLECATTQLTAGSGMIGVGLTTNPLVSSGVALQWLSPGSTFLFDDIPILTVLAATTSTAAVGGLGTYSTVYDLLGFIPATLQARGGTHRLTVLNAGINAPEAFAADLQLDYPRPVLQVVRGLAADGLPPGAARLAIDGSGFTPDSYALWDGATHGLTFVSRGLVYLDLGPAEASAYGGHSVAVVNPAPGGGPSDPWTYAIPDPGTPQPAIKASLYCSAGHATSGVLTLRNLGTGPLVNARIARVDLAVAGSLHAAVTPLPVDFARTEASAGNSVLVDWPPFAFAPGQTSYVLVTLQHPGGTQQLASAFLSLPCDVTLPVITGVPADIVVDAQGPAGAVVAYALPQANDAVSGVVPVSCAPASGSTFPPGTTTVNCTATDVSGNTARATFEVTVRRKKALCAVLGGGRLPDVDLYFFHGSRGEVVTVTLEPNPAGAYTPGAAALTLVGEWLLKVDTSALPNAVTATLPSSTKAVVGVSELLLGTKRFSGAYCVSLESSSDAWLSFGTP